MKAKAVLIAAALVALAACSSGNVGKSVKDIYELTPLQAGDNTCYVLTWTGRPYDVKGFSCVRNQ